MKQNVTLLKAAAIVLYALRNNPPTTEEGDSEIRKISQKELSEWAGISHRYYSDLERGKKMPTIDVIQKIAEVYDISFSALCSKIDIEYNKQIK